MYRLRTVAVGTVVVMSALIAFATTADAHVTVSAPGAARGRYAVVTFHVPNEQATATKVAVQLPTDTPLASVSVQPIPGWTVTTTTAKLANPIKSDDGEVTAAVSQIAWTARPDGAIKPGQFQQFNAEMGSLPDKPSITFEALQTYGSGEVVRWIESPAPGSNTEPAHPAPGLELAAAAGSGASSAAPSVTATRTAGRGASNSGPVALSIVALVLAAAALGLGVVDRAHGGRVGR